MCAFLSTFPLATFNTVASPRKIDLAVTSFLSSHIAGRRAREVNASILCNGGGGITLSARLEE